MIYRKNNISWPSGGIAKESEVGLTFKKSISIVQHINRIKDKTWFSQ